MDIAQETVRKIEHLRKKGYSIPEISRECHVSKSTALRRTTGIAILPKYLSRWLDRRNASKIISQRKWLEADSRAVELISHITEKDLKLIGAALYWAEGSKRDFSFSNTDPKMIAVFICILRRAFKVSDNDITISLRIFEDLNKISCLRFWSEITGIRLSNTTSVYMQTGSKKGKLKFGMCRIRVKRGGGLLRTHTHLTSPSRFHLHPIFGFSSITESSS